MRFLILALWLVVAQLQAAIPFPVAMMGSAAARTNSTPVATPLTNGVVFHLRLDEASGTRSDAGQYALNFSPSVSDPGATTGQITNGVNLVIASAQQVNRAYTNRFEPGNSGTEFTVKFWITNNTTAAFQYLFSKDNYPTDFGFALAIGNAGANPTKLRAVIGNVIATVDGLTAVTGNITNQVAMVYNGNLSGNTNRIKLYVNGADCTSGTTANTVPASLGAASGQFWIGATGLGAGVPGLFTGGQIDEFTFWNRASSATEIYQVYTNEALKVSFPNWVP